MKVQRTDSITNQTSDLCGTTPSRYPIIDKFERSGYKAMRETQKLAEFLSSGGQTIYLVKGTSRLNNINLMVHPYLRREILNLLDGVNIISDDYRFHSNMNNFPKKLNKGVCETAYGWQVKLDSLSSLTRFLSAFNAI